MEVWNGKNHPLATMFDYSVRADNNNYRNFMGAYFFSNDETILAHDNFGRSINCARRGISWKLAEKTNTQKS